MEPTISQYRDLKIICEEDCGNSPKKKLLQEFSIAFAVCDTDFVINQIANDVYWHLIGDRVIQGKEPFVKMMVDRKDKKINEIHIQNIITHGRTGAVNGTLNVGGMKRYDFCDIYNFSSAGKNSKIKEITSYVIKNTSHF
ncbi:DNA-binding protein [Virgibacillus phasianinus]|uniref:DNA-binding protein n=1 Tax=Virgibacillus phasianinus TaxID=2017483 RepID=A0A220U7D3_9BACI|nr:DNA-binding protein [Virgibacillus phasianinus]ASK63945.1 DNA-binding protein [Virgibacillus phasianinus]